MTEARIRNMINNKGKKESKLECSILKLKLNKLQFLASKETGVKELSDLHKEISSVAKKLSKEYLKQARSCHKMPVLLYCISL